MYLRIQVYFTMDSEGESERIHRMIQEIGLLKDRRNLMEKLEDIESELKEKVLAIGKQVQEIEEKERKAVEGLALVSANIERLSMNCAEIVKEIQNCDKIEVRLSKKIESEVRMIESSLQVKTCEESKLENIMSKLLSSASKEELQKNKEELEKLRNEGLSMRAELNLENEKMMNLKKECLDCKRNFVAEKQEYQSQIDEISETILKLR
jgi:aspartyl/asparaginyl beta-hydroxylase (cupin superfamily)